MAEPVLVLSRLEKSFGALKATDGVSLDLRPYEIHALIGPNGAGKTTLIHQITGALRPDGGAIRFLGEEIAHLSMAARARLGLARTFQVSSLLPDYSALRNAMLGVQGASGRNFGFLGKVTRDSSLVDPARALLKRVGLGARETVPAAELSHGERRQLEIALALALRPKALVLDEPMAGMGPEGAKALTGLLGDLKREAPILLVEHDMDAVFALADRVSVLVYGRLIASGPVAEIRRDPAVREAYLGSLA